MGISQEEQRRWERDHIERELSEIAAELALHERAYDILQVKRDDLVVRGHGLGISTRHMSILLGVTPAAVKFRLDKCGITVPSPSRRKATEAAQRQRPRGG